MAAHRLTTTRPLTYCYVTVGTRAILDYIALQPYLRGSGALDRQQASSWPGAASRLRPLNEACIDVRRGLPPRVCKLPSQCPE